MALVTVPQGVPVTVMPLVHVMRSPGATLCAVIV
jgi:hypothetical protein